MTALVRYEQARTALAECARIDEASDIRDKAAALAAYARQRDDRDLEVWVREIQLRACVRIGELSRELDQAERGGAGGGAKFPPVEISKAEQLAEAGLPTTTAHRYEQLAGGRDAQAQAAGKAAMEAYFAQSRADGEPATMSGLRAAVREAVHATLGPPPPKPARPFASPDAPRVEPIGADWVDFTSAVQDVARTEWDLAGIWRRTSAPFRPALRREAQAAATRITEWINVMEADNADHTA